MASFDIKSELDHHEITNAVDQANRVLQNRFDFKGTGAEFTVPAAGACGLEHPTASLANTW